KKTKAIRNIEEKMEMVSEDSLRHHILEAAKNFKISWIELGRALYSVWKDKSYKEWGYSTFEIYTAKEIGIKQQTAMKLLKSYYFLEKEEPAYLKKEDAQSSGVASLPNYESVNVLRLAKSKKIDTHDYENLKKGVFEKGKDVREVKKDLTAILRQREELEPEEAREKKRVSSIRRLVATLKTLKEEAQVSKLLSAPLIKETASLIKKLEEEIHG
ncbi:MAG: hypothetical protein JW946_01340, partial [Candidatus Omnitrophica bacterium]|nr:hypothetical protein [Candidatus Omnitrophota bacterium]